MRFVISIILGLDIYSERLVNEGIVTQDDVKNVRDKYEKICEDAFELAKKETSIKVRYNNTTWVNTFLALFLMNTSHFP